MNAQENKTYLRARLNMEKAGSPVTSLEMVKNSGSLKKTKGHFFFADTSDRNFHYSNFDKKYSPKAPLKSVKIYRKQIVRVLGWVRLV